MIIKRIILTILLIIWLGVIFMFSSEPALKSKSTSDNFAETIIEKIDSDITEDKKEKIIEETSFITRKLAHFTIYLVLGTLAYLTFRAYNLKKVIIISLIFCLIYAISDEIHQLFVADRAARVLDVGIDFLGSLTGILVINLGIKLSKKVRYMR